MQDVITDDELTALALAADPDSPLPDDAVSFFELTAPDAHALLPSWYMPATTGGTRLSGWRRHVAIGLIAAFLIIDAYGLCSTYGQVVLA